MTDPNDLRLRCGGLASWYGKPIAFMTRDDLVKVINEMALILDAAQETARLEVWAVMWRGAKGG